MPLAAFARIAMASALTIAESGSAACSRAAPPADVASVFRVRGIVSGIRRLDAGLPALDALLDGGIARGRISELVGPQSSGKSSLAVRCAARATVRGELVAWVEREGTLDPAALDAAGADLSRLLWANVPNRPNHKSRLQYLSQVRNTPDGSQFEAGGVGTPPRGQPRVGALGLFQAAELILKAGGFGLLVLDAGSGVHPISESIALRIARAAEQSATAVLMLARRRLCGTFAALSLLFDRPQCCFSRPISGAPLLFDGFAVTAQIARNKLGRTGSRTRWHAFLDRNLDALPKANAGKSRTASGPPAWFANVRRGF